MNELTDIEICKRIAEIEGIEVAKCLTPSGIEYCDIVSKEFPKSYNPLTDKALCFDLMVRNKLNIRANGCFWNVETGEFNYLSSRFDVHVMDRNPQRAICLAIIAKHK